MIKNNCQHYKHADGYPMPETSSTCRGCVNSYDPNLYDSGCKRGFQQRNKKLTSAMQKQIDRFRREAHKVNKAAPGLPENVETRN